MSRISLALLTLCALPAAADEPAPVKILARGPWPHLATHAPFAADRDMRQQVIRSPEELARVAGSGAHITLPRALKVDAIDFAKQMLLVVEDGTQPMVGVANGRPPSCPLAVVIIAAERDAGDKSLTVLWQRVNRRAEHGIITRPLEAVLVSRFEGPVTFKRFPDNVKVDRAGDRDLPISARAFFRDGWRPESPRQEWFVRDYADLIDQRLRAPEHVLERMRQEAAVRYAKALNLKTIDFDKQMVIGVSGGVRPKGFAVEVTRVERGKNGDLTVRWRLINPKDGPKPVEITHPAEVVLIERTTGTVKFREEK